MTAKPKSWESRSSKAGRQSDIDTRIRLRAYQIYEQRGRTDGFALDDWLQAEKEIHAAQKQGKAKAAKASR
jgi:Protein of unknown function (DUF2934)